MLTFFSILHILIAVGLVAFVLWQDPKGGAAGLFGGGSSSNSFFGASGAGNFLTATTKWLAVCFFLSCIVLTMVTSKPNKSVTDAVAPPAPAEAPQAVPSQPQAPQEGAQPPPSEAPTK